MEPIPILDRTDWLGDMEKNEFDIEMAYLISAMLNEMDRENPYQDIVEEDKKRYSPSQEELDINRLDEDRDDDE